MTISFSGLASGLDTDTWVESLVSIKQQSVTSLLTEKTKLEQSSSSVSKLQVSFNSLRTALEKLTDSRLGNTYDLFENKKGVSSNENVFTVSVSNSAANGNFEVLVEQLATTTTAVSQDDVSNYFDDETLVSSLGVSSGDFVTYVDGIRCDVTIDEGDTIADLSAKLSEYGINCSVTDNGCLKLDAQGKDLAIGTTSDTSNFSSILGFVKNVDEETGLASYVTAAPLYKVNSNSKLVESGLFAKGDVTTGTFTIGNAEFTIDENTTLNGLVKAINADKDSNVLASWDSTTGKLKLTSTVEGESYINVERGTSNITNILGFTTGDSAETSTFMTNSQNLGQNAKLVLDGTKTVISSSNTVTSDSTGLAGVTLYLKGVSKPAEGETVPSATSVSVDMDSSKLTEAVKGFVESYNSVMSELSESLKYGADLFGDTSLNSIKRTLRNSIMTAFDNDGMYSLLSSIGISTAEIGTKGDEDFTSLSLDETKFNNALKENPNSVKSLLVGDKGESGILSRAEKVIEDAVSPEGYFITKVSSFKLQISRYEDKITASQDRVKKYREQLEAQFAAMEDTIAAMQSSYSSFLGA